MGIREDVLALADDVESTIGGCVRCIADKPGGRCLSDDSFECSDAICREVAKRLRAIVERDAEDVTTMSAYDLLSDDDREAIAWVREMGGANALSMGFQDADNRRIELCSSLGIDLETGWADAMVAMRRRLMPEGMEWPKVDGKPVDFKTAYGPSLGVLEAVSIYNNGACQVMSHDGIIKSAKDIHIVKPKVLDADGAEIRVGDRLYDTDTGCGRTVRAVNDNGTVEFDGHENRGWFAKFLTHRAPVLAADGEPLREGEHVYHVETGAELVVKKLPKPGEYQAVVVFALPTSPASHLTSFDPNLLTHRAPVLAADGEPLEVGQTVYGTRDLEPVEIVSLHSKEYDGVRTVKCKDRIGFVFYAPDDLTHQRPVLDADGVPIKKGDTVYVAPFDDPLTVRGFAADGRVLMDYHSDDSFGYSPENLTHAKPDLDTWERIEEDATKNPFDYCKDVGHRLDTCENSEAYKARDLVRRAKNLAERGA